MNIKNFNIQSRKNVVDYLNYLHSDLKIPFLPYVSFSDYLNVVNSQPIFSAEEAKLLENTLQKCLEWCESNFQNLIQIGTSSYNFIIGNYPSFNLDGIDLNGPMGNAFVLLGLWAQAARETGWSIEEQALVIQEATSKDYTYLLLTLRNNSKSE